MILGRLTDTNLRDIYLTRFLNVISKKKKMTKTNSFLIVSFSGEPVILESSTKDLEVNEGDSVTLICNAQGSFVDVKRNRRISCVLGYPTPRIEWQKADARPLSSGHVRQVVRSIDLFGFFERSFFRDHNFIFITSRAKTAEFTNVSVSRSSTNRFRFEFVFVFVFSE